MCLLPRSVVGLLFVAVSVTISGQAGEAFFSKDGKTVTLALDRALTGLVQVDLATGNITQAPLPADLAGEGIPCVARGSDGEALFLAKDAVWVWTPGAATPVKRICATAPVVNAQDLFVATMPGSPLTDCLFISGHEKEDDTGGAYSAGTFYARKPGAKNVFTSVFCRRVREATGGAFSADGRLFFVSEGDLWEGGIAMEEDGGMERFGVLVGARIAPLAILNTDEANSGGMWAMDVFPAGRYLYVRLHGRHMTGILRMEMPAKPMYAPASDDSPSVQSQLSAMHGALSKTEVLNEDLGDAFGFCATEAGGKPLFFYCDRTDAEGKGPAMFLWDGKSQPRIIGYLPPE